jgi:hypothetical protein
MEYLGFPVNIRFRQSNALSGRSIFLGFYIGSIKKSYQPYISDNCLRNQTNSQSQICQKPTKQHWGWKCYGNISYWAISFSTLLFRFCFYQNMKVTALRFWHNHFLTVFSLDILFDKIGKFVLTIYRFHIIVPRFSLFSTFFIPTKT